MNRELAVTMASAGSSADNQGELQSAGSANNFADNQRQLQSNSDNQTLDHGRSNVTRTGDVILRRPRGRPVGSKNKTKTQTIITRESGKNLQPHIFEVSSGCDIFDAVVEYARRRRCCVCILSGSGTVTNVSLRQPISSSGGVAVATLQGRFEILSLKGSFLPRPAPPGATSLTIFLSGPQGQVIGGNVVGALIASGPVTVVATSFTNVTYERLPLKEGELAPPLELYGGGGQLPPADYPSPSGRPLLNLPQNVPQNMPQLAADGRWGVGNSAERQAHQ